MNKNIGLLFNNQYRIYLIKPKESLKMWSLVWDDLIYVSVVRPGKSWSISNTGYLSSQLSYWGGR